MTRFAPWAALLIAVTLIFGTIYVVAQQLDRQGADEAGNQLASQVASELRHGSSPTLDALPRVNLADSLAPFVVVYDRAGHAVHGNGYLDGALAAPPAGVITDAAAAGSNSVTWQPREGLRFATVEVRSGSQVVMAAKSLIPTESRADELLALVALAWFGTVIAIALVGGAFWWLEGMRRPGALGAARGERANR